MTVMIRSDNTEGTAYTDHITRAIDPDELFEYGHCRYPMQYTNAPNNFS